MKTAFLFDLDGTLVDSAALHDQAFRQVLAESWPEGVAAFDYERVRGLSTEHALAGAPEPVRGELIRAKRELYRRWVTEGRLQACRGAGELLQGLGGRGRGVYVVSSGSRESVTASLVACSLIGLVHGVITAEDAERAKPAPDLYLAALARFGLDRVACLAVEDAQAGVEAAREARIDVVLVGGAHGSESAVAQVADLVALRRMVVP
jgi:HAD superfamily hydrolase (TIGR01509 family)